MICIRVYNLNTGFVGGTRGVPIAAATCSQPRHTSVELVEAARESAFDSASRTAQARAVEQPPRDGPRGRANGSVRERLVTLTK